MNTISTNTFGTDRKNKQNLKKFVSIISDYEDRLNNKVDDLVKHIIGYSKKVQDSVILPEIKQPQSIKIKSKSQTMKQRSSILKQNSRIVKRDNSINSSFSFMSDISQNVEEKINNLKKSVAQSFMNENTPLFPEGRPLGNKRIVKPKFSKRVPDIVPRQIRLDPFSEKNIIKAQDLDKGVLSLIQKGKIGKDVDIITAFQKGGQILNTKQAIFHHGQERLTRNQPIKSVKRQSSNLQNYSRIINKPSLMNYQGNNWAITMPDNQISERYNTKNSMENHFQELIMLENISYLKFLHYLPVQTSDLKKFKIQNLELQSQINQIFFKTSKLLEKYSIQIAYVNSSKIIQLSTLPRKVTQIQTIGCILNFKDKSRIPLKDITNLKQRKQIAIRKIQSLLRMRKQRKVFVHYLQKKKVQKKISNWFYNCYIMKNFRQNLKSYRQQQIEKFINQQRAFKQNFQHFSNQKHYEIHISNKSAEGKSGYREVLNTEITRIFNFQNPHTHIIIILSDHLSEQTKNYYYKIMQLQQIPNFKERVTFLNVRIPSQLADKRLNCSEKLYYDSKLIRQLKRRVGPCHAYFRISYPSITDIQMSSFLQIPILTGNLFKLLEIEKRSKAAEFFDLPQLKCFKIQPKQLKPLSLSTSLIQFCENHKRYKNYVIKINDCYQSKGIGLLTYPFDSLPGMYSNTAFITTSQYTYSPSQFYRQLCKKGGIIQVFQQNLNSIVLIGRITNQGQSQLVATYDKLSYGFVNVGYFFPQMTVQNSEILAIFNSVSQRLSQIEHFGDFQISLFVDQSYNIFLDKVQCYQTEIGSSLFYFKFLCQGNLNAKGQYITKIIQTFQTNDNKQQQLVTLEPRSYCYIPYILHFGLSQKQVGSFFQLCRMGGISFDLQNKFGSTFILLGSLKNSMGMITTARDRETCKKLMLKSLDFIIKQNSHNNSKQFIEEKQKRMKQRQNIIALKERLEDL